MTLHGILPNKARTIEFPSVPKQYMSHFIRAYFDGDGYVKYEKCFMSIVGGSKSFMKSLRDEIENNGFETNFTEHDTHYRVYVSRRKTIKLFSNWLYENKGLFLKRKYEEFQKEKLPLHMIRDRGYKNAVRKRKALQTNNFN